MAAPMPPPEEPYIAPPTAPRRVVRHARHRRGKVVHHRVRHRARPAGASMNAPAPMAPAPAPMAAPAAPNPSMQGPRASGR